MPHSISWLVERRVVHERFYGIVTVEDVRAMNAVSRTYYASGDPPVHNFVDLLDIQRYPTNINQIRTALVNQPHPYLGWIVIVLRPNPLLKFITTVLVQLSSINARMRFCYSYKEAIAFLQSKDPTLPTEIPLPFEQTQAR